MIHTRTHRRTTIFKSRKCGHHYAHRHSTSLDDNPKMSFVTTSHNSWLHHLQATSVTLGGVPIKNHKLYSQHKICNIIGHNPWLPNQEETIRTSHNSHTHTYTKSWWRIVLDLGCNLNRTEVGMNPKTKRRKMENVDWGFLRNGRKSRHLEKVPR